MDSTSPEPQAQPQNTAPTGAGGYQPSNGAHVNVSTPTIYWNNASPGNPDSTQGDYIASYTVYINTATDFSGVSWASIIKTGIITNSWSVSPPLADNTTYYWKVFAYDSEGEEGQLFAPYQRLIVNSTNSAPTSVTLISPTNGATITSFPRNFDWNDAVESDPGDNIYYVVHLSSSLDFTTEITSNTGKVSTANLTLTVMENTTYYWYVVTHDTNSLGLNVTYSQSTTSRTVCINLSPNEDPLPFNLTYPINGEVVCFSTPTINWDDTTDPDPGDFITFYEIHLSSYSAELTSGSEYFSSNVYVSQYVSEPLVENASYNWLVVAHSFTGGLLFTDSTSFVVDAVNVLPSSVTFLSPNNMISTTSVRPVFIWTASSDPDPGSSFTYKIYLSTNNFATAFTSAALVTPGFIPVSDLTENAQYAWKVDVIDNQGGLVTTATNYFWVDSSMENPNTFNLNSPDGTNQNILKTYFDWDNATDPDVGDYVASYEIWYSTTSLFTVYTSSAGLTVSSFSTQSTLIGNATYYWKVRAVSANSGFLWSTTKYFYTTTSFPLAYPEDASVRNFLKTYFVWNQLADPDPTDSNTVTYDLFYTTVASFNIYTSTTGLSVSTYTIESPLINSATYYWKVRAIVATGALWSSTTGYFYTVSSFTLSAPTDGSNQNYLKVNFDWNDLPDPAPADGIYVTYEIHYSTDILFRVYDSASGLTFSSYTTSSALINSATYYWKVIAQSTSGYTNSVNTFRFITGTGFDLLTPANESTAINLRPSFDWSDMPDPDTTDNVSVSYEFQYSIFPDFSVLNSSAGLTSSSFTLTTALLNDTTYFWRVRAVSSSGSSYCNESYFKLYVLNQYPAAFSLSSPADFSVLTSTALSFRWQGTYDPESEIISYYYRYSLSTVYTTTGSFTEPVFNMDPALLTENAKYLWYVQAKDLWQNTTVSNSSFTFYVNFQSEAPSAFSLMAPMDRAFVSVGNFDWQNASDPDPLDTVRYEINYSTMNDFSFYYSSAGLSSSNYSLSTSLIGQCTYYWRVKAYGTQDPSSLYTLSSVYTFYTPTTQPAAPAELRGVVSDSGSKCTVSWEAVFYNSDGSVCSNLQEYRLYKSRTLNGLKENPELVATLDTSVITYADTTLSSLEYFYMVRSVNSFKIESAFSAILYINPSEAVSYRVFSDLSDEVSLNIPGEIYDELNSNNDIHVAISRINSYENSTVLRAYDMKIDKSGVSRKTFSQPLYIQFSYRNIDVADPSMLGVAYHDGVSWQYLACTVDTLNKVVKIKTYHLTEFRFQLVERSTEFELLNWPLKAKVFTPNNDNVNDELKIYYSNPQNKSITGKIMNINGMYIADMANNTNEMAVSWDCKTQNGYTVTSGIYIYQLTISGPNSENKIINGTIVVAK